MITSANGNLLTADVDALVNTVNTAGIMGKGIALQFKRAYPAMFKDYEKACKAGDVEIGRMHVWETGSLQGPRIIINFPTKKHWKSRSRLADIEAGLVDLVRVIREYRIGSIAIPPLGCGHGGLNWGDVEPRIIAALEPLAQSVDIRIYPPAGTPPAREMVDRSPSPRLTHGRAALLAMIAAYRDRAAEDPTLVVVQKLMYLLQVSGEPLNLKFVRGRYGPYADNLRKTLRDMEGHHVDGFGDGSATVSQAEPLTAREDSVAASRSMLAGKGDTWSRVLTVLELIEGYESPYGLELLASVHWVATEEPAAAADPAVAARLVRGWTSRKARMFTDAHIHAAWTRLATSGWLGASPSPSTATKTVQVPCTQKRDPHGDSTGHRLSTSFAGPTQN